MYLFLSNFEIDDVELFNINYFFLSKGMWLKISGDKDAIDLGYIFIFNHDIKREKKGTYLSFLSSSIKPNKTLNCDQSPSNQRCRWGGGSSRSTMCQGMERERENNLKKKTLNKIKKNNNKELDVRYI